MDTGLPVDAVEVDRVSRSIPRAMTSSLTALHLPCGMAIPEPMPGAAGPLAGEDRVQDGLPVLDQPVFVQKVHQLRDDRVFIFAFQRNLDTRRL